MNTREATSARLVAVRARVDTLLNSLHKYEYLF